MTRSAEGRMLLLALVASGCADGQQAPEFRDEPATQALVHLAKRIRLRNPSERIIVHGDLYCGFPVECFSADGARAWPPAVLDGALRELGANIGYGDLRAPLMRSADLVVAFGPIRIPAGDSMEVVVRYERRRGARITLVSMRRMGAEWSVESEETISTASYIYAFPYLDTLETR